MKFETTNEKYKLEIIINYMAVPRHSIIGGHNFQKWGSCTSPNPSTINWFLENKKGAKNQSLKNMHLKSYILQMGVE